MAETQLLRQNAIVRNATQGNPPPHGPVKTGELPLVQVKQTPSGPLVQEGQQKPVTILPPSNAESAVKTGGLPMVKVKMADGKPQIDDGRPDNGGVVIRNNRQTVAAGNLPMVQVKMENGRPQVQTVPNVQPGPPQIPAAAPAVSAPRMQQLQAGPAVTRVVAPRPAIAAPPQVQLPSIPELTTDQHMLLRHTLEGYLAALRSGGQDEAAIAAIEESDAFKFAAKTAADLDDILVATAVHAEAAAIAAANVAPTPAAAPATRAPVVGAYVAPRPVTGGHFSPASLSPQPPRTTGYVAQVPGTRSHVAGVRSQGHASMAPRRVQRQPGAAPLPPVNVQMNGNQPMVQPPPPVEQPIVAAATEQPIAATAEQPVVVTIEQPIAADPHVNGEAQG
jgi:hypothetical protein